MCNIRWPLIKRTEGYCKLRSVRIAYEHVRILRSLTKYGKEMSIRLAISSIRPKSGLLLLSVPCDFFALSSIVRAEHGDNKTKETKKHNCICDKLTSRS